MYADIIIDITHEKLDKVFQYRVPEELEGDLRTGAGVIVPFGRGNRETKGYIVGFSETCDYDAEKIKDILRTDTSSVAIEARLVALAAWMKENYGGTMIQALKTVLPIKRTEQQKEQRILKRCISREAGEKKLEEYLHKNQKARARLMAALLDDEEVEYSLISQKLNITLTVVRALEEQGVLKIKNHKIYRNPVKEKEQQRHFITYTEEQERAIRTFENDYKKGIRKTYLLYGVTGSGKTEVYIHLIEETIRQGKQVLYLLPEIALTAQITERLQRVFGSRLGIYHSKFPDAERVEIWQKQLSEADYDIILGVRSSVFLPFRNLGLVIVDEEHENTYKQQDPAPRYHARNAAIVLASMYGAKTLLGTATPSVETWHNATSGKYGLVELKERYKEIQLPEIIPVDIKELHRKKMMNGPFSPLLLQYIREALEQKEQVILFQNRRGFAPMIECNTCGWVPKCKNCDVSLTYHKGLNQLTCHYCGYTYQLPRICPACEGTDLRNRGFGTEKIEDDIKALFPDARVARMDLDTTRTRTAYERIISDFQQGKTDILIGTQMVSKGLDFDHVSIVGILNADTMLNYPDFRAYERAFQLMAQVAGRAGRKNKRGRVVLQTKSIDHPIIPQVIANDYEAMVGGQLAERQMFHYPPYYRLVYVYLKNRNETLLDLMAQTMAAKLRTVFGNRVLGPDKPPVARVQTLFIRKIVLKIETNAPMARARELLVQVQKEMVAEDRFKSLIVYYDVDPM